MDGDDHGVRCADGLVVLETEGGLGCVVWGGVLWRLGGLCGQGKRESEERDGDEREGGDVADGAKRYLHGLEKDRDWSIVRRNGGGEGTR
jgi:hypothetical protein